MNDQNEHIEKLKELRAYVLSTRRDSTIAIGDKDGRIKSIIQCQQALKAIDEAILEEEHMAKKPGEPFRWFVDGKFYASE